jgi:hypothetical protein
MNILIVVVWLSGVVVKLALQPEGYSQCQYYGINKTSSSRTTLEDDVGHYNDLSSFWGKFLGFTASKIITIGCLSK